ncbi:MAG: BrnT family toxin [Bacteroidota bacterium]|jgi:uncharacterized DUF497 family protein|nr:BrnT family toxin [Ignavibacteria bacterium]HEX2962470.1 BrnT family toxin [Ignavibacteriales bacterium]MCU7500858.1 BrnT family toxin [Ignavibacteria bacterium]MCU7511763.1 BrnT family toxin [Ignavibacteria bacterium]MCU7520663.1 BrnT family toxin [Ignavibacteria bacterium]
MIKIYDLPEPVEFEWDKGNIEKNLIKHNVSNSEIEEVFINTPLLFFPDPSHSSEEEKRHGALGRTHTGRMLQVIFTIRKNKIRAISARDMSRKERQFYEEAKRNSEIQE